MFETPTGEIINGIKKVHYTHDGMIDLIIANPWIRQREIAQHFGMSENWVSRIFNSEVFRKRIEERKGEIVDPVLLNTLEDRMRSVLDVSIEVLEEKLREGRNGNLAVRVLEHGSR